MSGPEIEAKALLAMLLGPHSRHTCQLLVCCLRVQSNGTAPGGAILRPIVLKNAKRVEVHVVPVGASIQRIMVPDKNGFIADVVLGFDSADEYLVRCSTVLQWLPSLQSPVHSHLKGFKPNRTTQRALEPLLGGW